MKRIELAIAILSLLSLVGCLPEYYPGFFGRLDSPVMIPMEDDRRNCRLIAVSADAGHGHVSTEGGATSYVNLVIGGETYERNSGAGIAIQGSLGRARVDRVPGYNGTYDYYDIAPVGFISFYTGGKSYLLNAGGQVGLYAEGGAYARFRRAAADEDLIMRDFADTGAFGDGFFGFQMKYGRNVFSLQQGVGFPELLRVSLAFGRGGHNVWVNVFPVGDLLCYSLGYKYWIR